MTPYDSEDLTDIIEQHHGQFVVLQSPDTAEHDPCYEEVARFDTLNEASAYIASHAKAREQF